MQIYQLYTQGELTWQKIIHKKYKEELENDFDFFEDIDSYENETIADMMSNFVETNTHQQMMALELTKLIVENRNPLGYY